MSDLHIHFRFMAPLLMDIRTRLPAEALAKDPRLTVTTGVDLNLSSLPADQPKLIVTQRAGPKDEEAWLQSTANMIRRGWLSVLEFDDHPEAAMAVTGEAMTDQAWRHYGHFHAIQTSTPRLAKVFAPHNPEVAVFANAVFDLPPLPKRSGAARVFYGSIDRGRIAVDTAAALGAFTAAHPEVHFVVVRDRAVFEALPTANKSFHQLLGFEAYLALLRTCDICLTPLEVSQGALCKSDAKFLDAAAQGVVAVASPPVYGDTIVEGETGFIAHATSDWAPLLTRLVEEPALRERVAAQAWAYVRDERLFSAQVDARVAWYQHLWDSRHALTRQLFERSPRLKQILFG